MALAKAIMAVLGPAIQFITPLLEALAEVAEKVAGAVEKVVSKLTGVESSPAIKIASDSGAFSGGGGRTAKRNKSGEDFVMADWTPAVLDYGERVLTREENFHFNALGGLQGMERMASSGSAAQSNGSSGGGFSAPSKMELGLKVSPREMAHAITPYVIKELKAGGKWEDLR